MWIGVDIGATKTKGVLISEIPIFPIKEKISKDTKRESKRELLEELKLVYTEIRLKTKEPIISLGIGVPGVLDNQSQMIIKAPNIPLLDGLTSKEVKEALGTDIIFENDANCFTLAEHLYGAGKGSSNMIGITLGSGVGGGVIIDGKLYRGSFGGAGEVGHMIVEARGEGCTCGGRGCFEMYASEKFLKRESTFDPFTLERLLRKGEKEAKEIVKNFSWWVALGLLNVIHIIDPGVIVIGGGLVGLVDFLFVEGIIRERALSFVSAKNVKILKTQLGEYAGAIGAALLTISDIA